MDRSSSTLKLNQAILRTSLLLADHSQSCGDVNESELMVVDSLILSNYNFILFGFSSS